MTSNTERGVPTIVPRLPSLACLAKGKSRVLLAMQASQPIQEVYGLASELACPLLMGKLEQRMIQV